MITYILVIVCLWTIKGLTKLIQEIGEDEKSSVIVASLVIIASGVLAIIFTAKLY